MIVSQINRDPHQQQCALCRAQSAPPASWSLQIRQAILVGHPTLGPRDMISLLDIYHKFIEIDPRQPKSLVKRMILMAAGIVTPNMKKSMSMSAA